MPWKYVYVQINIIRHSQNLTFKNVLLSDIVFTSANTNQMHIAKKIRASWYYIKKTIDIRVRVNQTSEIF
jgi:hypothetical protein